MADFTQFQKLYEEHMPKLYRYVYSRSGLDSAVAEDLTSEIFMKALEHFDGYKADFPFGAWLFGIARNHLIDHYKRNAKKKTSSLDEIENLLASSENIPEKAESALWNERLQQALKQLPPEKQELVTLRYVSGYSYAEMAKILGKEENAVKVATFRVTQHLKDQLSFFVTSHDA
ncbi:MAG: RNA polymerase sigma factor [Patescibacteria group bacterium]